MKIILSLCVFLLSVVNATEIESLFKSKETTNIPASQFAEKYNDFQWEGENTRVAISKNSSVVGFSAYESLAYFTATGKLVRLDSWLYNKGDQDTMSVDAFEKMYLEVLKKLSSYFGVQPKRFAKDGATRGLAYSFMISQKHEVRLLVGYDKKKNEANYLSLVMRNYATSDRVNSESKTKAFLKKTETGDVYITKIPMIDQGDKGYCVPATLTRIGQHYGVDVSMHELAMVANSSSDGGTSPRKAMDAVKKGRIALSIRDIKVSFYDKNPYFLSAGTIRSMAKKISEKDRNMAKFEKEIIKRINRGRMVAWSMMVGAFEEKGAREGSWGGHMRMIIGYNLKTHEILYSDSWGRGHELKRWPLKYAYLVTTGLYDVVP
ncbi:C39 family peptidase [Lentisphaera profundi]|uniref:C39 family peptidase n=1 Tax=Lentisphaera profundi TaxID=1658616 RepID=A0ABY7VWS7_9BACT|nr:C39 family peptidase [Lentisphaera profundi]WDE98706.1 C39 family peptidase [Lentisphaera profundi]